MSREQQVQQRLLAIGSLLKQAGLWQHVAPVSEAFSSTEPFCLDTMTPLQWLQWILLPKMQALLDAGAPLPVSMAIAPYYEVALEGEVTERARLLHLLNEFDQLFESP
ncbi:YqcC family protein [Erwinia tasmaniensis]|uniref:YqcC-like domain-containing protein n=1 Tax=Erwinia tasmaniensis (strain DSM 17950 / CFBP 7177 / CIP 109463 / NCPPB 4357 / Et1/99) TaxID=465817 RepID=B2VFW9_ERWT9|nr:YqcC family protein [Erwinia tasmaniensis]CAO97775.1 Conserved hypothetical protein (DUF446) [Erwinia tasmaniensis Et1/99]